MTMHIQLWYKTLIISLSINLCYINLHGVAVYPSWLQTVEANRSYEL